MILGGVITPMLWVKKLRHSKLNNIPNVTQLRHPFDSKDVLRNAAHYCLHPSLKGNAQPWRNATTPMQEAKPSKGGGMKPVCVSSRVLFNLLFSALRLPNTVYKTVKRILLQKQLVTGGWLLGVARATWLGVC